MQHMFPFLSPGGKPETLLAMLRRAFFAVLLPLPLCAAEDPSPKLDLKPEVLHPLLVRTAQRIQEKFQRIHPEASGLVQTVEEILAMPVPEKKDNPDDPAARIGARMELMTATFGYGVNLGGIHGYIFDNSEIGHQQTYHDLELETATGAAEVCRWLEMKFRAEKLEWKDKTAMCGQRAISTARALVFREPKNAEAHTLLAFALDWDDDSGPETLTSLQTALKLDPKCALARQMMLARRAEKAAEAAALRRESRLDEKAPQTTERALYDRPLDEAELLAFTSTTEALRNEAAQTLANAYEQRHLAAYLRTLSTGMSIENHLTLAARSRQRDPTQSFEAFSMQNMALYLPRFFALLDDEKLARGAIELASGNGEALGTLVILGVIGRMNHLMRSAAGASAVTDDMLFIPSLQEQIVRLAREGEGKHAARACEAVCLVEMMRAMVGMQPRHQDLVLRIIELDPFRHRTLQNLLAACMAQEDKTAGTAITRMQLAVLPCLLTRRQSAAAAASLHDWDTAHRLLDSCDKENPGDLMVLSQRVATTLRQSQSRAAIKKASLLYGGITPDTILEKTAVLDKSDRQQFLENFLLHLVLKQEREAAVQLLKKAVENKAVDEQAAAELKKWIEK